uniref:F-actin monooxygenase n=1 Tax=Haemonchus contortus TaxID=6289 RepID=A0A7I4Y486_HAECO
VGWTVTILELGKTMAASSLFDNFITASTFRSIQNSFYQLCVTLDIDPSDAINVYPKLRLLNDWKAQKLWKLLDKKWELAEYKKQKAGELLNVLVIGAGPCGLRSAIECALLGCRVVLVEQRDRFSRNNVLHLWEFVIQDLKSLGAKIFYPKFCTGSIEHISIRQLQCILLKAALCFGVQIHDSVTFVQLLFPKKIHNAVTGFRACLEPKGHILADYDIDVLIGADGKRNTIPGFPREEMRGKLAIGITANFVNNKTPAEERVPEISGVAYIFNQAFFKEMYAKTGVDLENIVYYKDDTHYFVMCAKKQSLLDMGVILQDNDDVSKLLSSENVDQEALCRYAQAAADFATNGKLPALNFAKNHRGNEDVAMFDFTSLYSSKCSVRLVERMNKCLLMGIVGDSLHEPFWPTGSGCARGFLGVLDTAWLIREYGLNKRGPLEMIAERESIYRLLAQVTKDNMNKAMNKYTIDPRTRYVSLESTLQPEDVVQIVSSDNPRLAPIGQPLKLNNNRSVHLNPALRTYSLWKFCHQAVSPYKLRMFDMDMCWNDGRALAALIAKFRPEVIDYFSVISSEDTEGRLQVVFKLVEESMGVPPPCTPSEWHFLKVQAKVDYIGDIVDVIRCDKDRFKCQVVTPRSHVVQKRRQQPICGTNPKRSEPIKRLADNLLGCSSFTNTSVVSETKNVQKIVLGNIGNERVLDLHVAKDEIDDSIPPPSPKKKISVENRDGVVIRPVAPVQPKRHFSAPSMSALYESVNANRQETCQICEKVVYLAERMQVESMFVHKNCFRCSYCNQPLRLGECGKDKDLDFHYPRRFFCKTHLRLPLKEKISRIERCARLMEKNSSRDGILTGLNPGSASLYSPTVTKRKEVVPGSDLPVQHTATLSFFPAEHLRDRTVQRMRDNVMGGPISPVSEVPSVDDRTPERAEFSNHLRKSSTASCVDLVQPQMEMESLSSASDSEGELDEDRNSSAGSVSENDASISDEEGDELGEGDLEELERTVLQYSEEDPDRPFTEEQVVSVIERINRRRNPPMSTPGNSASLSQRSDYPTVESFYTPMERFTHSDCSRDPGISGRSSDSMSNGNSDPDIFATPPSTVLAGDIKKRKAADLERLRTESRLKAKLKTDEELGLGQEKSMSIVDEATPSSLRSGTILKNGQGAKVGSENDQVLLKEGGLFGEEQSTLEDRSQLSNKEGVQEEAKQPTPIQQATYENAGLLQRSSVPESALSGQHPVNRYNPNDVVHSESRKETNILANSLHRFKMRREAHSRDAHSSSPTSSSCTSPHPTNTLPGTELESREVPLAAVAPSPRLDSDEGESSAHISLNERNIRLFQRRAEKIRRQHDDERRRGAQEIQRGLQECEIRLEEIKSIGQSLELKLIEDPENEWAMDSWFALVHERELLKSKEEMLRLSKREVELEVKYRDLNMRFKQLGEGMNDNLTANSDLLAAMLAVVEEKKEVNRLCEKAKQSCKMINANMKALREKGRNFEKFRPVFASQ